MSTAYQFEIPVLGHEPVTYVVDRPPTAGDLAGLRVVLVRTYGDTVGEAAYQEAIARIARHEAAQLEDALARIVGEA